ncbi:unnamed protein product [Caenorhabditis auriculariae]|uniref:Uncharacterized protein n=1 Tax=Caenorhabditis auriculariae TaxID=2777116 RepID=A0A8S1HUH7_9PELO|nr:unnamed protein product [Caenorhabditis auriculariae]
MSGLQRSRSLIQRKKEQWAKEKENEADATAWFPFGSPGGGSPNRKFESKTPTQPSTSSANPDVGVRLEEKVLASREAVAEREKSKNNMEAPEPSASLRSSASQQNLVYSPVYPPHMIPYHMSMAYSGQPPDPGHDPQPYPGWGYPYAFPQFTMIPPGAIPINTHNADGSPICPVSIAEQVAAAQNSNIWGMPMAPGIRMGIPIPPPVAVPQAMLRPESRKNITVPEEYSVSHPAFDYQEAPHFEESESPSRRSPGSNVAAACTSRSSNGSISMNTYESQIAEKRRMDAENAERERVQDERRARERAESYQRREQEELMRLKAEEERLREEQRRTEQFVQAKEKAEKEAELFRKARLYKHVLVAAEKSPELPQLEKKLLGVDEATGERLLREVSHYERQKKIEWEQIEQNAPPKKERTRSTSVRGRNNSVGSDESNLNGTLKNHQRQMPETSQNDASKFVRSGFGRSSVRVTRREHSQEPRHEESFKQPLFSPITPLTRPRNIPLNLTSPQGSNNIDAPVKPSHPTNKKSFGQTARDNRFDAQSSALFSPIETRKSRRMRPIMSPSLEGMARGSVESHEETSSGSLSPDNQIRSPAPSSTENMAPKDLLKTPDSEIKEYKVRSRSALDSPSFYLNGGRQSPLSQSILFKKLEQKGCGVHTEDTLSPDVRRKAEANLSRSPSMASLRGSLADLSQKFRGSSMSLAEREASPSLSKFQSMTSASRLSFNLRKNSEKQKEVLERLARLRESLHSLNDNVSPQKSAASRLHRNNSAISQAAV